MTSDTKRALTCRLLPRNLVALIHEQGRAAEWVTSLVMLSFGVTLLLPGETMAVSSSYAAFRSLALAYLASTDWLVVRQMETGQAIPDDVQTARAGARAKAG